MFSREGYRFLGWFEDLYDENTKWRDHNEVTADTILYAKWAEIPDPENFRVGSVGSSGRVTSADATLLARYLIGHDVEICLLAADINGDGYVDSADIILLARWIVGNKITDLIAHQPVNYVSEQRADNLHKDKN